MAEALVELWFGELHPDGSAAPEKSRLWFAVDPEFDKLLAKRYGEYPDPALMGAFDRWLLHDVGLVALILLLDQIPRNIYRGKARAFYYDQKALMLAREAYEAGRSLKLPAAHAVFSLMPLMHAEDLKTQDQSVEAFEKLYNSHAGSSVQASLELNVAEAHRHRSVIQRFGRFPRRNAALGRPSTEDELNFLKDLPLS